MTPRPRPTVRDVRSLESQVADLQRARARDAEERESIIRAATDEARARDVRMDELTAKLHELTEDPEAQAVAGCSRALRAYLDSPPVTRTSEPWGGIEARAAVQRIIGHVAERFGVEVAFPPAPPFPPSTIEQDGRVYELRTW